MQPSALQVSGQSLHPLFGAVLRRGMQGYAAFPRHLASRKVTLHVLDMPLAKKAM